MSEETNPVPNTQGAETAQNTGETTEKKASAGTFNASTPIAGMDDLKKKAPQLYRAMLEGIAWKIIGEMRHHAERLKKIYRESNRS